MKSLHHTIVHWVDQRIEDMLSAPRMWGGDEAVEMQLLLLFEMRALAMRPAQELDNPSRILDTYAAYLAKTYPTKPHRPLCQIVESDRLGLNLAAELRKFRDAFVPQMLEENPYQHHHIAIQLTFKPRVVPTASAVTGYYEEFRRAARAVARPRDKAIGRPTKGVEAATDFSLNDVRMTHPNGHAATALLLLGAGPGQQDLLAQEQVHDALANLITMGEWAGSGSNVSDLPVDDVEQRTRVAVQSLRILPQAGISQVAIGGKFIGRARPVEFHPEHEKRIMEVIGSVAASEPFDRQDETRGVDLDRGLVILGQKERLHCYVRAEDLGNMARAGVQAHVRGTLFRPLTGKQFVRAEKLDWIGVPDED
ncbi:MAG: hypothetical protein IPM54_12640 [Polyangiaceae bacterium]|nr:hypothetical protein [Polyangiaceae bacterium]